MKTINAIALEELCDEEEDYDACNNIQGFVGLYNAFVLSVFVSFIGVFVYALFKLW